MQGSANGEASAHRFLRGLMAVWMQGRRTVRRQPTGSCPGATRRHQRNQWLTPTVRLDPRLFRRGQTVDLSRNKQLETVPDLVPAYSASGGWGADPSSSPAENACVSAVIVEPQPLSQPIHPALLWDLQIGIVLGRPRLHRLEFSQNRAAGRAVASPVPLGQIRNKSGRSEECSPSVRGGGLRKSRKKANLRRSLSATLIVDRLLGQLDHGHGSISPRPDVVRNRRPPGTTRRPGRRDRHRRSGSLLGTHLDHKLARPPLLVRPQTQFRTGRGPTTRYR